MCKYKCWKFVHTISYISLVGISPYLQLRRSWGQKTNWVYFEVRRSEDRTRPNMVNKGTFRNFECGMCQLRRSGAQENLSGEGVIPFDGSLSRILGSVVLISGYVWCVCVCRNLSNNELKSLNCRLLKVAAAELRVMWVITDVIVIVIIIIIVVMYYLRLSGLAVNSAAWFVVWTFDQEVTFRASCSHSPSSIWYLPRGGDALLMAWWPRCDVALIISHRQ